MMYRILILLVLCSCMRTEVLNVPKENIDTILVTKTDTTIVEPPDTTDKVPIGFNPSINNWDDIYIDINL